jgi:Holliday junction resolvase
MSYRKGADVEREIVNLLWKADWAAIRIPASGKKSRRHLPDIIAMRPGDVWAIEVKSTKDKAKYIKHEKVYNLLEFSEMAGCESYIACKFKPRKGIWVARPHDLEVLEHSLKFEHGVHGTRIEEMI